MASTTFADRLETLSERPLRAFVLSIALHGFIFGWILLAGRLFNWKPRIPMSVTTVTLVSLSPPKKGPEQAAAAPAELPKLTVEQMRQVERDVKTEIKAKSAEKPMKQAEPVDAGRSTMELKKSEAAKRKAEEESSKKAMNDRLSRLRQEVRMKEALSTLAATETSGKPIVKAKGTGDGTGSALQTTSENGSESGISGSLERGQYQALVRNLVLNAWNLPPSAIQTLPKDTFAVIVVYIDEGGNLVRMDIERSSQIQFFDQSATRAVRRSLPFPAPPSSLVDEVKKNGLSLRFTPQKAGS